jgi:hypothetical protein
MNRKHLILMIFTGLCTLLIIGMNAYPFINNNGAGGGYDGGGGGGIVKYSDTIEDYIVKGGGYFLKADSDIKIILRMVELQDLQGIDYREMQTVVNSALENMNNAKQTYEALIQKAGITPYNQAVIDILKNFDYGTFRKENGLNSVIFSRVRSFLQMGDITGIFKHTYSRYLEIIVLLDLIKQSVYRYRLPGLSIFWRLNEKSAFTALFGSYVARVFYQSK